MGCSCTRKSLNSHAQPAYVKSRDITIKPSTFVRKSNMNRLSDYCEVRKIGSGAFAEVMLCNHTPTQTQRALKMIHKSGLSQQQKDPVFLLKEIQILKDLDHPNILKCFEIFEDEQKYYVATEFCSGGDLFAEILKMQKFTESHASMIMYQLFTAVSYCHELNVIHRDLKPENILLSDGLNIKVADFGSSCIIDKDCRLQGCYGSAYYISPEVLTNNYNEKCDVWSLGVIMYILLTGRPPYKGKDTKSIIAEIRKAPLEITSIKMSGCSSESIELLKKLLIISPELRISAKEAIKHPWIQMYRKNQNKKEIEIALNNLKMFNCESKLKEAVYIFLASQVISNSELNKIKENFRSLDKDGNGKLTKDELLYEYKKYMKDDEAAKKVDEILMKVDQDNDGFIDYTEFLITCKEYQKQVSRENLEIAFKMFDIDGSGTITVDEIKTILENGQIADDEAWMVLLKEADTNGDGAIDLEEFVKFMLKSEKSSNKLANNGHFDYF